MEHVIRIIGEAIVLIFNVLIYMQLTVLKRNTRAVRAMMYAGSFVIVGVFFVVTCTGVMAESLASFLFVTFPSFLLFFLFSKYKDSRFFVTFCFLDTVTLILTFFSRSIHTLYGNVAGIIGAAAVAGLMLLIYIKGKPRFRSYRALIANVQDGWAAMAVSTFLIYLLLVISAAFPRPMIERPEYVPVYLFLSVTVLSFYAVFLTTLAQKKKLSDLNVQLLKEQRWHKIAYNDALTGMKNRMAYMEEINQLERTSQPTDTVYAVMLDIDNFKNINDTLGHHIGDLTLQNVAQLLRTVFPENRYSAFRIGGDEFAVIAKNVPVAELEEKLSYIKACACDTEIGCSFSVGYCAADFAQKNAMENAFIRADKAMYHDKLTSKAHRSEQ